MVPKNTAQTKNLRDRPASYTLVENELHRFNPSLRTASLPLDPSGRSQPVIGSRSDSWSKSCACPTFGVSGYTANRYSTAYSQCRTRGFCHARYARPRSRSGCLLRGPALDHGGQLQSESDPARHLPPDRHEDHRRRHRAARLRQVRTWLPLRDSSHADRRHGQQHASALWPIACPRRAGPVSALGRSLAAQPQRPTVQRCERRPIPCSAVQRSPRTEPRPVAASHTAPPCLAGRARLQLFRRFTRGWCIFRERTRGGLRRHATCQCRSTRHATLQQRHLPAVAQRSQDSVPDQSGTAAAPPVVERINQREPPRGLRSDGLALGRSLNCYRQIVCHSVAKRRNLLFSRFTTLYPIIENAPNTPL